MDSSAPARRWPWFRCCGRPGRRSRPPSIMRRWGMARWERRRRRPRPALALPAGGSCLAGPAAAAQSERGPGVFQAALSAGAQALPLLPGKPATVFWSYNGQVPGPTIEVFEGDEVRLHFENRLSQPTTIHWHGLPIPADQDGNPQDPVPAGQSREYRFILPQGCAGSYWYHPHPHGHTAEQVYMGLAGVFVVKSRSDPLAHLPEQRLVLSDLKLDAEGKIAASSEADRMDGREGQSCWSTALGGRI
ncbi:multicopper oxidase domain-containing protein [Chromobacterium haemolyticum]|nr:multicopper oxidase domain-containing protein [Chromobacterium haemolyticum]